jgi:hypothetical protein
LDKIKKNIEHEDGTVFSKKKMPGMSCASCGNEPVEVYSGAKPNVPWGKLICKFYYPDFI